MSEKLKKMLDELSKFVDNEKRLVNEKNGLLSELSLPCPKCICRLLADGEALPEAGDIQLKFTWNDHTFCCDECGEEGLEIHELIEGYHLMAKAFKEYLGDILTLARYLINQE
jgi:hypothetical protein